MDVANTLRMVVYASLWLLLILFLVLAAVDALLAFLAAPSIGHLVQRWARHYPAFAVGIIFLFGALLGHFFTQH